MARSRWCLLAWIGAALAAPVQAAERVDAEVVEATRRLVLVRTARRSEVVALEPGATLAGIGNVQDLRRGDRVRFSPAREEGGVRFVTALELLPPVAVDPQWSIDFGDVVRLASQRDANGRTLVLDVRSGQAFARGHLPGAVSAARWRTGLASILPPDKGAQIVLYGYSRQDADSVEAFRAAVRLGYGKARFYAGGYREWSDQNRATLVGARDLAKRLGTEPLVVLDVRPPEEAARGSLPRSVSIVPSTMSSGEWIDRPDMPTLVVVGRDGGDPAPFDVAERIRAWQPGADSIPPGTIQILEGGFAAWVKAGGAVEKPHPALADVPCIPLRGEICPAEFMRLWRGGGGPLILDVRAAADSYRPAGARHVPLADLPRHVGELPRDREYVVVCGRGVTSRVGQAVLERAGLKARFVRLPAPAQP